MAYVEPMDVDNIGSDFDDKENSLQNSNVLPRTPCTEKGYEELDVSELNMKLRYSITPASSPMSRSYTANYKDNKILNQEDNLNKTIVNENCNLTRSLNSTLTKCENVTKSGKLPLQALSSDQFCDSTITSSIRRSLDTDINNCTITVNGPDNIDDNLSLPSTTSSCMQTPEATTPTKDIPKDDGGSPIMRGLKSVLNMFRSSQSPIPTEEINSKDLSSVEPLGKEASLPPTTLSSTPINTNKNKENNSSKRNSPLKDSVTFNDDLERELQWKDETTIIFKHEKIPIHKLFFQQPNSAVEQKEASKICENLDTTVEHMDISYNESFVADKTVTDIESKHTYHIGETISCVESDSEFVDCETTYTKNEEQSTFGLSLSVPNNTENQHQDVEVSAYVDKENEALSEDLKTSTNITLEESDIETKMKDVTIVKEAVTSNEISENNVISTAISNINNCSISHNDGNDFTTVTPVLDDLKLNMKENYSAQLNKDDVYSLDSKNDANIEINKYNNDLNIPQDNVENIHVNDENSRSEIEEYMNDVTKPLNIITDYQEYLKEKNSSVIDSTDKNSTPHLGLLKECGTEESVNRTIIQHDPDNVKHDNITEILNNELKVSCNISDVNNGNYTLDTIDHTNGPDLTYFDGNHIIDVKNMKAEEINESNIREPVNEESNLISHCLQNIDHNNPNDLDLQKPECDLKHESGDNSNIDTDIYNLNQINTNCIILEKKSEYVVDTAESKKLSLNEICDVPSDIPLPPEDDLEKSELKDALGAQEENVVLVTDGDVVTGILTENSNVVPEVIQSSDNISSDLLVTSTHLKEVTVPKQILSAHKEIINEIQMTQDYISPDKSSANIATDNIDVINSKNSKINSEIFDSIPNADTCYIDKQINIDDCTNNKQSVFDDKFKKPSDNQEEKLICQPMDITNKTRAADNENTIPSNDNLHVSVENLNNQQDDLELENIENPFETKTKLGESPPISPKLGRKGYNINFDDIDDPFATKTNIRTSPPPPISPSSLTSLSSVTPNEAQKKIEKRRVPLQNRQKSQSERKNQNAVRKPFNKSFDLSGLKQHTDEQVIKIDKPSVFHNEIEIKKQNVLSNYSITDDVIEEPKVSNNLTMEISASVIKEDPIKVLVESNNEDNLNNITKVTSENVDVELDKELQKSTKSSKCDTAPRNVFNLPEIDDVNFNPFATKSRVRDSPPPTPCSPKVINDKIESKVQSVNDITINIESTTEEHKHLSPNNVSSSSGSSKNTDVKENTIREVQTEDEDTIEGPFFEAEELNDIDKMTDFESNKDMIPFEDFPAESEKDKKEELFIDAEAFEFLLNQNKTNVVADSGKESLFLKFDPLYAKRVSSDGVLSALNRIQKRQSTPKKLSVADKINETVETTTASSSTKNIIEESVDESSFMASKPMMVVNPAVQSLVSPRKSTTPPRINRRSLTFTSPAMAVIDRLLSLSGNTSLLDHDTSAPQATREYNDTDIALTQLRELLAEKEIHVHNLRSETKELKERLASMESQVRSLEKESEDRLNKVTELNNRLADKTKINKSMSVVVEEYERTIATLIAEMDQEKRRNAEERTRLISERDEQTAHLVSMEVSFTDLHSKYEKSKQIILSMKANEDTYKKSIKEFEDNLIKMQKNYELLKQHATSKLNHANQELEKINRSQEAEVLKLNAMIKRKELHITSLEESLTQKTKANEELTAICDELINKPFRIFDSIPNADTCYIDKQINIDDCTNNKQSVFDDKFKKPSDNQEEKLICQPMDITNKTRAADNENTIPSNDNLHVSVENLNNQQDDLELENIENPFETKTKLGESPPISPKLGRKGYNINFDDIDDPFATKTNIRTSPPPPISPSSLTSLSSVTPNEAQKKIEKRRVPLQNRQKSQSERKNQNAVRKPFNKSFDLSGLKQHTDEQVIKIDKPSVFHNEIEIKKQNVLSNYSITDDVIEEPKVSNNLTMEISASVIKEDPIKVLVESNNEDNLNNITKVTSENVDVELDKELQKSTKSSKCDTAPRNVFNLPEIDDVNFNPFATKSRVRDSPPPTPCSPKVINDKIESKVQSVNDITINIESTTEEHKHLSPNNVSSSSGSSKNTDVKENTIREVQTEDEDTIEGPFFEAEELNDIDKMTDFESNKDMIPFEDFPAESEKDKKEELFIDAEAFEFLLNQNKTNVVADSGKESLFLKFDPLYAKRVSSDGVLSALNRIQKRQSTPKKLSVADKINETVETTTASSSTKNIIEESVDESSFMASKPMMVVNPAVQSLVSPRKSTTPPRINRRSLTFTSPAMAVIDRLLSLSGNTSLLDHDTSAPQATREYNDTDIALTQLRELLAEKEIHVHNLRSETKELKERLASMESQVRSLEKESEDRLNKVTELNNRLADKTKINKSMSVVVEEYERTIATLIAEMDQEKRRNAEERTRLISERDEQTAHLVSMEVSFTDLHSKYEKSKQIILSMKANEDTYKKSIKEFEDNLIKMQKNYELLKQHATSKLNHANQELEKINRSQEAEVLKLNAMIKRKELHITSLEESLTQKTKANEELTAICDELINKVS